MTSTLDDAIGDLVGGSLSAYDPDFEEDDFEVPDIDEALTDPMFRAIVGLAAYMYLK